MISALRGPAHFAQAERPGAAATAQSSPHALLEVARAHKLSRFGTSELMALCGAPRRTVQRRLAKLVRAGLLERFGAGRATYYEDRGLGEADGPVP